jgi:hypothetical protein
MANLRVVAECDKSLGLSFPCDNAYVFFFSHDKIQQLINNQAKERERENILLVGWSHGWIGSENSFRLSDK